MLRGIKFKLLSAIATLALAAAVSGAQPASFWFLHQPEVPEHLKKS